MFFPEGQIRVQVYGQPVDLRKSFDGLYAITRHVLGQDPLSGQLFVFFNVTGNYAASSAPTSATRTKASAAGSERTVLSRPVA
ncbi:MAG: IS66 family insertion sequence element accessory protein TnpB [Dechloromonas sp.]|nr:IS66 family insertion sequence element accessory protein TnpB [Candidatus Dechloromonas phosphoritropha]